MATAREIISPSSLMLIQIRWLPEISRPVPRAYPADRSPPAGGLAVLRRIGKLIINKFNMLSNNQRGRLNQSFIGYKEFS